MEKTHGDISLEARRQRELDDLQNEIAGRETGRAKRFRPNAENSAEGQRRKREREAAQSRLLDMLANEAYRERYDEVFKALTAAQLVTESFIANIDDLLTQARTALQDIRDRAARLPDGTRVYRDANGQVRRADGSIVERSLAETILWTGNEPSYEDFGQATDQITKLEAQRDEAETYQNDVLAPAQDRISDEDNPPTLDELDKILDDIESGMPVTIASELAAADNAGPEADSIGNISLPPIGTKP